jgi:hypothetical protein
MAATEPFLPLDKAFEKYPKKDLNYTKGLYDGITVKDLYLLTQPLICQLYETHEIIQAHSPPKELLGANSIVLLSHIIDKKTNEKSDVAIKIFLSQKQIKQFLTDDIMTMLSKEMICPPILFNKTTDFGHRRFEASVLITQMVTPIEYYHFKSIDEIIDAIKSFIRIVCKLHQMNLVHNDIKLANVCIGIIGNKVHVYLIDMDNCDEIITDDCDLSSSSYCCHPSQQMIDGYIRLKQGNKSIDLFSTVVLILGYILNMSYWQLEEGVWDDSIDDYDFYRYDEKEHKTSYLNRLKLYKNIQYEMRKLFPYQPICFRDPFWTKFCDLVFLIFKGHQKCADASDFETSLNQLVTTICS